MTGVCPLCQELIITDSVCDPEIRGRATVQCSLELIAATRAHWESRHTPKSTCVVEDRTPPWLDAMIASTYGAALGWAGAVEVAGSDRRGFVFSLFWLRQQLLATGYDPLNRRMGRRPVELETAADVAVDPLIVQGRIEAYEGILRDGVVSLRDVADCLRREMNRYGAAVLSVGPAVVTGTGAG